MYDWEKFNEKALPEKEECYSNLNMEDITDADYMHVNGACKDFETKLQKNVFKNLSFRSCKISLSLWINMVSSFKKE